MKMSAIKDEVVPLTVVFLPVARVEVLRMMDSPIRREVAVMKRNNKNHIGLV